MQQYCVYTRDFSHTQGLFTVLDHFDISIEPHINRTRFWLDLEDANHMYVYMRYSSYIHCIAHETDHALGI